MVSIKDEGGKVLSITLNSSIKFGLIYNPVGDMTQAMRGYRFKTIGEVMSSVEIPQVITATKTFRTDEPWSSVLAGEVLVIRRKTSGQKLCVKAVNLSRTA